MEHVMREVNRLNAETEVESRKGEEEKQAKRLARQKELDDMHRAIMEMGDDGDISGTWILNLSTYFSWGELEWTWEIASPDQSGFAWGKYKPADRGILKIEWADSNTWRDMERKFEWREERMFHKEYPEHYDYAYCGLEACVGTVTFTSSHTCKGVWKYFGKEYEFIGRKVDIQTSESSDNYAEEFEKLTERITGFLVRVDDPYRESSSESELEMESESESE